MPGKLVLKPEKWLGAQGMGFEQYGAGSVRLVIQRQLIASPLYGAGGQVVASQGEYRLVYWRLEVKGKEVASGHSSASLEEELKKRGYEFA